MGTEILYNSFSFSDQGPVPFLNLTREIRFDGAGNKIGSSSQITLEGTLTPLPSGQGYILIDELQDNLFDAFKVPGRLQVLCDSQTLMDVNVRPTVVNIPRSNDNWVQTAPFSIQLQYEEEAITGTTYVNNVEETWSIQVDENSSLYDWSYGATGDRNATVLNITHQLSAVGAPIYSGSGISKTAFESAKEWVVSQLGVSAGDINSNNVINLNGPKFSNLNHIRVENSNERGGTYAVTETWVGLDTTVSGLAGNAIEDFTASIRKDAESATTTIDIAGSIQGLEVRNMSGPTGSFAVTTTKYANASGFWNNVQPKLLNRAKIVSGLTNVNATPLNYSVAHGPSKGTISYQYTYDTRPCNLITDALFENIQVVDIHPTDVFASLVVLGRANGPLLQSIGTVTESRRAVNIDVVVPLPTECTYSGIMAAKPDDEIDEFLCEVQADLESQNVSYFLTQNQRSWNPKNGRYTVSVEWVYTGCSGTPPSTSFCV